MKIRKLSSFVSSSVNHENSDRRRMEKYTTDKISRVNDCNT